MVRGGCSLDQAIRDQLKAIQRKIAAVKPPETPIMKELPPSKHRPNRIQIRGNFLDPGDAVEPGVPAAFNPFPKDAPKNRLGVAEWLMAPDNPLTARVAVNRLWAQLFGRGLVETQEDFGSQGQRPIASEIARLAGGRIPRTRLVDEAAAQDDRDVSDLSAGQGSQIEVIGQGSGN